MLPGEQAYMKAQIHDNLRLRDTEDLLEIWQRADHEEWTDLAFEVVQEILLERLGEIPARKPAEQAPASYYPGDPAQAVPAGDIRNYMRLQTYETLDEKDTQELIDIWREADHREWNETAFDVVRQILLERIGELPTQEPVVREADEQGAAQAGARLAPRVTLDVDPVGPSAFNLSFKPINLVVMHCPDCGKAISEQDQVCPQCGADLEAPLGEKELQALAGPGRPRGARAGPVRAELGSGTATARRLGRLGPIVTATKRRW